MRRFGLRAWWRRFPLRVKTMIVAGTPLVLLTLGVPLLFSVQREAARVSSDVEHAYRVRQSLATVLKDLLDAETGMRGFLLTNDTEFLSSYRIARSRILPDLMELERRLSGSRPALARFEELEELAGRRMSILERIRVFGENTPNGEIPEGLLDRGRKVVEEIRAVVGRMDAAEADALAVSRASLRRAQQMALIVSVLVIPIALGITLLGLLGFASWLVRGIRRVEENARRLEAGEPLVQPPQGDDELARLGRALARAGARLAEQEAELRELALEDPLTGLPNRRAFLQIGQHELQVARRRSSVTALLFIDVDGLKRVNDELGHLAGDQLLREIADVITTELRASDLVARVGGDEFCVLLSRDSALDGSELLGRLEAALGERNRAPGRRYQLSFSVGVAFFDPLDPVTIEELIARADREMYQHKHLKRAGRVMTAGGPAAVAAG
jgi:diguanylate cyclase (GGDEF)-like protein